MNKVVGNYVCSAHLGKPSENDYHHVEVVPNDDGGLSFRWINRAGTSWNLTCRSNSDNFLSVGSDCPYFSNGYSQCKVERDGRGEIIALVGPWNERYERCVVSRRSQQRPPLTIPTWKVSELGRAQEERRHAFILPLSATGASWDDLAFLAAIPACATLNQGRPAVLVPGDLSDKDDDAFADFLVRYKPTDMTVFHSDKVQIELVEQPQRNSGAGAPRIRHEVWDDLHSVTVSLAKAAWPSNAKFMSASLSRVVAAPMDDYAAALLASSLAARIGAPLFFVKDSWDGKVLRAVQDLRPSEVIFVGKGFDDNNISNWIRQASQGLDVAPRAILIAGVTDAISWLISQGLTVDYLAVVNPADRTAAETCASRKLSLTGPVYSARRDGLVVPVPNVPVNNTCGNKGPTNQEEALQQTLHALRSAIAACPHPTEYVALVGGFDVVPTHQTDSDCNNSKIYAVSDIPYGQLEGHDCSCKKFRDMAIGRIYAESLSCGTLLAARTVNYELLLDGKWETSIVEAGSWGFPELSRLFQLAGVDSAPKHLLKDDIRKSRVVEAAAILHKAHSSAVDLGNFVTTKTAALYTPAVVLTRGCHGAGIDEGNPTHGSVAGRMLGRGCVCYVGSPRSPTTSNTLTEVAFFHELLYGGADMSVGQAMQTAYNKAMVHHLDGGHMNKYCLENEVLLGDPALVPCFANAGVSAHAGSRSCGGDVTPASASLDEGGIVTVVGPSNWLCTPIHQNQLKEWKYKGNLSTFVAPRVEQETIWCGNGYDRQELYHVVSVDLPPGVDVRGVTALDAVESSGGSTVVQAAKSGWTKRWWPSGRYFLQNHWDGSTTVRWRLRLVDYDMQSGAIKAELKSARFSLDLA